MEMPLKQQYTEVDYNNIPEDVRAEIIDGQIYYHAAPSRMHQGILMELSGTIRDYIKSKEAPCKVYPAPFAVKLREDKGNIVEPDISVICDQNKFTDSGCTGAPDWIIKIISPCNSIHDYIRKLNLYADGGVREYWIVNPMEQTVLVYLFDIDNLKVKQYTFQDKVKVNIYEDFSIDFLKIK